MKTFTSITLFSVFLYGCAGGHKQAGDFPVIDLTKQYPTKEIVLQDIADVEYISLNNKDAPLIGNVMVGYISNDYYMLYDRQNGDVFVVEKSGHIKNHFNHKGNGAKEYQRIAYLTYDPQKREIYILDGSGPNGILVYSESGVFIRYFPELAQKGVAEIYDFDDQTLLIYFNPKRTPNPDDLDHFFPYVFIYKQDGKIQSRLDLSFSSRISERVMIPLDGGGILPIIIAFGDVSRKSGNELIIADLSADTLYTLSKDRKLTPMLARTPSVHDQNPYVAWSLELKTDQFINLNTMAYDFEAVKTAFLKNQSLPPMKVETYLFNIKNHEIVIPKFINADYPLQKSGTGMSYGAKNLSVRTINAERLTDALGKGELNGKLKEVAQTLNYDDNPVLMVIRYK